MTQPGDLVERLRAKGRPFRRRVMDDCVFCGRDPYHYVDNGVGMERVAVVCCELGIELHGDNPRPEVMAAADRIYRLISARDLLDTMIAEAQSATAALSGEA